MVWRLGCRKQQKWAVGGWLSGSHGGEHLRQRKGRSESVSSLQKEN
jgi:hypothetical protein